MLGFESKEKREETGFIVKTSITIVGAIFAIIFGTAHLAKFDQEQLLKAKLVGSTEIQSLRHGEYITSTNAQLFCDVSGSYQVTNIGQYPFIVDDVRIELWELPYIDESGLYAPEATSYSLSERLNSNSNNPAKMLGKPVEIEVNEQFGVQNRLERSFGFIIPISQSQKKAMDAGIGSRYVIVANASARLDDRRPWYSSITKFIAGDSGIEFLPNDLQHFTWTFNICEKYSAR